MTYKHSEFIILDLSSYELNAEEKELLQHPAVAGVVLFTRNYAERSQLQALTQSIKQCKSNAIIAVDQEGGRVQRFIKDFTRLPAMSTWGEKYTQNPLQATQELRQSINVLCTELQQVGVNLNFIPVLDINYGISEIIGERSLNRDPNVIIKVSEIIIDALHAANMPAIGKHYPGHGGVEADSHLALPIDTRAWEEIAKADLLPFKHLATKLDAIMPAHIIYAECDENLTTYSDFWLQKVLRQQLQFQGLIVSDDLTMAAAALAGSYPDRAVRTLEAGADLVLICNHREGAIAVLDDVGKAQNYLPASRLDQLRQRYAWH